MTEFINWQKLEQAITLDDLPELHRAFLSLHQPGTNWDKTFLRQVQGKVQAQLKQLERAGLAKFEDNVLFVAREAIPARYHDALK